MSELEIDKHLEDSSESEGDQYDLRNLGAASPDHFTGKHQKAKRHETHKNVVK